MRNPEHGRPSLNNQESAERPRQELIRQKDAGGAGHEREHTTHAPPAERDAFYEAFWGKFMEKASILPALEDPAYWPVDMLNQFVVMILSREDQKTR